MGPIGAETGVFLPLELELLQDFVVFLFELSNLSVLIRNYVLHFRYSLYQSVIMIVSTLQLF
jgi:hypothetical protein